MKSWIQAMLTTGALLLWGCGIWANLADAGPSNMRGAWLTQSARGMVY